MRREPEDRAIPAAVTGRRQFALVVTALLVALALLIGTTETVTAINVAATVSVGNMPRRLAYNPTTNKVYVPNEGGSGNTVSVIDSATDTVVGSPITVGNSPYGVGVNPNTNKIYVTNENGNTVSVIDGATDTVIGSPIAVGSLPRGIGVNPVTNRIYVANETGNSVSVINGATDTVIGSPITVGAHPHAVGVNPTNNKIYVANQSGNSVSVIDGATATVIGSPITVGSLPTEIGANPTTNKIYVSIYGSNSISVIDSETDAIIGSPITVGTHPTGVGVNPITNRICVANQGDNTVSAIDGATDTVVGSPVSVGSYPYGVAVNLSTNKIYVANSGANTVSVLCDPETVSVGSDPVEVGVNPTTNKIYVANDGSNTVTVIDGATDTVVGPPIAVGTHPWGVGVNPTTNKIYVANFGSDSVSVIDGATDTVVSSPSVGGAPSGVCVNPMSNKIYVSNSSYMSNSVSVIEGTTDTVIGSPIAVGSYPFSISTNPITNKIYVANWGHSNVSVINGATDTVIGSPIAVGSDPAAVGVNSTTNKVYVANQGGNSVSVIDGATGTVVGTPIAVGRGPTGVSVNLTTDKIYVANQVDNTVSVICDLSAPTTASLSPDHATAGEDGFPLAVNGTGFIRSTVVRWNGSERATTYISDTWVAASIPATDIQTAGTAQVVAFTPGGGQSNAQTFTVNAAPTPHITSLSAPTGTTGTVVTITGTDFGDDPGTHDTNYVRFGTFAPAESDYVSWTDTVIQVKVPVDGYEQADVKVHTSGGDSNTSGFTIMPFISGINPVNGPAGTEVTIVGTAFAPSRGTSKVMFGATDATSYTSWGNSQIKVNVPSMTVGATNLKVRMSVGDSNSKAFTVDATPVPTITNLSTQFAPTGNTVTVNGTGFGDGTGSHVDFGTFQCAPTDIVSWTDTAIVAKVPASAYFQTDVKVHTDAGGDSNAYLFYVQAYISTVSPTWGNAGVTYITLTGYGFGPTRSTNSVWFDGSKATTYSSWTNNQIRVQVGAGAQGQSHVKVMVMGCYSNAKAFDVRPLINSITPTSGPTNTVVTISGSSFCNSKGTGCVYFGSKAATTYTSWKQTQIKVKVPSGISGTVQVKVYTTGGMSNGKSFTKT